MSAVRAAVPADLVSDVETLWHYHQLGHELRPVDVAIGLGSHDPGVATHAAELYHRGLFPLVIFTGANAPTTVERFPRGEAVHYREIALDLGVPDRAILIETEATNTAENITFTRRLVDQHGLHPQSAVLITRPYQQRRAYATSRKLWPELDVIGSAQTLPLDDYVAAIGDANRVINTLVGDTQRIRLFTEHGFAIPQDIPDDVAGAFDRLVSAGYNTRLL
jgi:hypothetical protein